MLYRIEIPIQSRNRIGTTKDVPVISSTMKENSAAIAT